MVEVRASELRTTQLRTTGWASRSLWTLVFPIMLAGTVSGAHGQSIAGGEPTDSAGNRPQIAYDAVGIRLGEVGVYPTLTTAVTFDSNVFARRNDVISDGAVIATPAVAVRLDRPGLALSGSGQVRIRRFMQLTRQNDEQYRAELEGNLDVSRATSIVGNFSWARSTTARGTFENGLQVGDPLREERLTGRVVATHRFNRLELRGTLSADRFSFDDLRLDDGTILDQSFRNGSRIGGVLGTAYEISPRFSLTAQGSLDRFDYVDDRPLQNRNATAHRVSVGGRYELTRLLIVDLNAGVRKHDFKNPRFGSISGLALNGRLRWYPTPLVSLRLDLSQSTSTSAFDSVSAVVVTSVGIGADYELRRNVIVSAKITDSHEQYGGIGASSNYLSATGRVNWKLNRWLRLDGQTSYDRRAPSSSSLIPAFSAWRFQVSLTLAR